MMGRAALGVSRHHALKLLLWPGSPEDCGRYEGGMWDAVPNDAPSTSSGSLTAPSMGGRLGKV